MSDNTDIPILVDGDTGYGNFNNARRLVKKLEQRGIAGVCIEDKSRLSNEYHILYIYLIDIELLRVFVLIYCS
jgi:2-methylisocitrate lyase-like PEP mutase family enzyme